MILSGSTLALGKVTVYNGFGKILGPGKVEVALSAVDETPVFTLTGGIFKDAPHLPPTRYEILLDGSLKEFYEIDPKVLLRSYRTADARGEDVVGCFHSHTHTDAFPSPTDISQAPDPEWHYVVISLRVVPPVVRSFRIVDGHVTEEPVTITE